MPGTWPALHSTASEIAIGAFWERREGREEEIVGGWGLGCCISVRQVEGREEQNERVGTLPNPNWRYTNEPNPLIGFGRA